MTGEAMREAAAKAGREEKSAHTLTTEWRDYWKAQGADNLVAFAEQVLRALPSAEPEPAPVDREMAHRLCRDIWGGDEDGPRCRDCADHDGFCPNDNAACNRFSLILNTLTAARQAGREEERREIIAWLKINENYPWWRYETTTLREDITSAIERLDHRPPSNGDK